jgi:uncharacterized iron-regulated membrane protein
MRLLGNGLSVSGLAVGAGVVLLAPVVIPVVGAVLKPLAKAVIKGGIMAYEGAKVSVAETRETIEDLAAEAKSEIAQEGGSK